MILEVQAMVEKGASKEKIGLRGPMPPGMLFAVYDSETGKRNIFHQSILIFQTCWMNLLNM